MILTVAVQAAFKITNFKGGLNNDSLSHRLLRSQPAVFSIIFDVTGLSGKYKGPVLPQPDKLDISNSTNKIPEKSITLTITSTPHRI